MKPICRIYLAIFILSCGTSAFCQSKSALNSLVTNITDSRERLPVEKLYLQTDKPAYVQEDTVWFKAYLFNADYFTASTRSGLLYVELDDENNKCVKRIMLPLVLGLTWGDIALIKEDIPEGTYTLRAYTNWMQNFGEDYVFKKQIYIASAGEQSRLVAANFKQSVNDGKHNIRANILISNINDEPVRLRDMQLRVMDGRHTLLRSKVSTGLDGKMDINFDLPDNTGTKNLSIRVQDITKGTEVEPAALTIPVILNRPENIDLQFMPEGGNLVTGITAKVGFKAIDEDGKGIDVSGQIYNSKQQEVATFRSLHNGMGSFELTPQTGENYTAKIVLPNGVTKSYPLPEVAASGTGLSVNSIEGDSLKVSVSFTPDLAAANYFLIGQSRGVVCYAAGLSNKKPKMVIILAKSLFPTGIAHFTLLNAENQPLNERICFINHHDNLQLNISANKITYVQHDSIALAIKVTDATGKPVRGSFSLAVTDDAQVKPDSLQSTIVNNLLFTSDLKGTVEEPGYYFENNDPGRSAALDNLMLTQGWVGYDWKQLTGPAINPAYAPEDEFKITGGITNIFNKPVAGAKVLLLSKKPSFATDTLTDKDGRFTFAGFMPVDTAAYIIEAKNKHGKEYNVGITLDEFKPPVFTQIFGRIIPWYVNSDTSLLHSLNDRKIQHEAEVKLMGPNVLKEVVINAKKVIKGSHNLNGNRGADQTFDEKDMEKAGKMSLLDILKQKIDGFEDSGNLFVLHGDTVNFIVDGINLDTLFSYDGSLEGYAIERYQFLKGHLDYIKAEDIIGIEAMWNISKKTRYDIEFYPKLYYKKAFTNHTYIEVTTRSGNGAYLHTTSGVYEYKPLAFSLPKQFYRPKYAVNSKNVLPDLRSTIHWEPNIMTDTAGKATVSFYSADKPSGYTIVMEGSDMNGQVGAVSTKIKGPK